MGRYGQEAHHAYVEQRKDLIDRNEHIEFSKFYRTCLIIFGLVASFLTSGVIFGWPAVLMVLHREGVYNNNCPGHWVVNGTDSNDGWDFSSYDNPNPSSESGYWVQDDAYCHDQMERLNLIFVLAVTAYLCTFLFTGFFLHWFGPRMTCGIGAVIFLVGSLLFAFSSWHQRDRSDFDGFLPGYILMAIGGPFIVSSFVHLSNLFPHSKGLIITTFNIAVDASSLCFVPLEILNNYYSCSRRLYFLLYSIIPALLLLSLWVWPRRPFTASALLDSSPTTSPSTSPSTSSSSSSSSSSDESTQNPKKKIKKDKKTKKGSSSSASSKAGSSGAVAATHNPDTANLHSYPHHKATGKLYVNRHDKCIRDKYSDRKTRDQISTSAFLFLTIFTVIHLFRLHYYISFVYYQLLTINPHRTALYTRLFTILLPITGILSLPLIRLLLDYLGMSVTFLTMIVISLIANMFWVLGSVDGMSIGWQIFGFIAVGIWRAMLLSAISQYVVVWFGMKGFGKLWGVMMAVVGVVGVGVWFVGRIVNDLWGENWKWMNVIMLGVGAITVLFVLWVEWKIRKNQHR